MFAGHIGPGASLAVALVANLHMRRQLEGWCLPEVLVRVSLQDIQVAVSVETQIVVSVEAHFPSATGSYSAFFFLWECRLGLNNALRPKRQ